MYMNILLSVNMLKNEPVLYKPMPFLNKMLCFYYQNNIFHSKAMANLGYKPNKTIILLYFN
jgi:hypothetical protein